MISLPSKLVRRPARYDCHSQAAQSSQVHSLPEHLRQRNLLLIVFGAVTLFGGLIVLASGFEQFAMVTLGLFMATVGASVWTGIVIWHFCVAQEVRFTRESMVIHQTARPDLVLPFDGYQREWVVDCSGARTVRIIIFGRNRGCTVIQPPEWFYQGLEEIARIQAEEGWYAPAEE